MSHTSALPLRRAPAKAGRKPLPDHVRAKIARYYNAKRCASQPPQPSSPMASPRQRRAGSQEHHWCNQCRRGTQPCAHFVRDEAGNPKPAYWDHNCQNPEYCYGLGLCGNCARRALEAGSPMHAHLKDELASQYQAHREHNLTAFDAANMPQVVAALGCMIGDLNSVLTHVQNRVNRLWHGTGVRSSLSGDVRQARHLLGALTADVNKLARQACRSAPELVLARQEAEQEDSDTLSMWQDTPEFQAALGALPLTPISAQLVAGESPLTSSVSASSPETPCYKVESIDSDSDVEDASSFPSTVLMSSSGSE